MFSYLAVVKGLACPDDPQSYAGRSHMAPGRVTHARKVCGEGPDQKLNRCVNRAVLPVSWDDGVLVVEWAAGCGLYVCNTPLWSRFQLDRRSESGPLGSIGWSRQPACVVRLKVTYKITLSMIQQDKRHSLSAKPPSKAVAHGLNQALQITNPQLPLAYSAQVA